MSEHGDNVDACPRYFQNVHTVLPEFDPVKGEIDISLWIEKIEEFGELYDWDEVAVKHYGLSKLSGVARKWRDSLPSQTRSWNDWKSLLRETFCVETDIISLRLQAQNYKWRQNQDIVEYYFEKLARCNKCKMTESETIEWIVHGLDDNRFKDYLGPLSRYDRLSKLLVDLKSGASHIRKCAQKPKFTENNVKRDVAVSSTDSNAKTKKITCFKCSKMGHYARDCPEKKRNDAKQSPKVSTTTDSDTSNTVLTISTENSHAKYFKSAFVNNKKIDCYIDMGSSCVTMREDVVTDMGFSYFETKTEPLVGYGNGMVKPLGLFTGVVSINDVSAKVKIHVVPKDCQKISLIVGHPYTEQPHIQITSRSNELKVEYCDNELPVNNVTENEKTVLHTDTEAVVPSNYLGHIAVVGNIMNRDLCVEGSIQEKGQAIPRCVITTDHEGKSILPVLNISGEEMIIPKGTKLTRAEQCFEEQHSSTTREVNKEEVNEETINTELDCDGKKELKMLLDDYRDLIAKNIHQLGCTDKIQMDIQVTGDAAVYYRPYRLSHSERQQVKDIVEELKSAKVIEDAKSPFASPVILVKKKSGDVRLCIDYRALNKMTVKDHYPLPLIDDQLDLLRGKRYFSSLDLRSGYYQVPLTSGAKEKSAFITPDGHYQFNRMSFGLCNAPAVFQRLINTVLGSLRYDVAMAYLDDIIIPSTTIEEGMHKLRMVFEVLRDAGLTLKLEKCYFFMEKVEYLGYEISETGIQPGSRKLESLVMFPTPKDVRTLRSFVGLASYFRRFVGHFSIIMRPLTDLLSKSAKFEWKEPQDNAFCKIKEMLTKKPVLSIYDTKAWTEVHTDASSLGIAGVLFQTQSDGLLHPISYFSRKTTKDESKYHAFELEALAVVCTLERFRVYLIGIPFVIRTDCNSLKMLANKRDLNPRIGRWFVRLSEYNYTIEYHKGSTNVVADALSRNPVEAPEDVEVKGLPIMGISISTDWVAAMQRDCNEIASIREKLEQGDRPTHDKFTLINCRVYRCKSGRLRLYVPEPLRSELVSETHKELMHLGIEKTLSKLKENYYFPKMKEAVTTIVLRCINCLYYKTPRGKQPGLLHPLDKGKTPFQSIHMDHLGPFQMKEGTREKYVAVAVDGFSKYTVLKAVTDVGAASTIKFAKDVICHYGKPERIITDRGTAFTSKSFEEMCDFYEIQHVKIGSGSPRANGQVERVNSMIISCLATSTNTVSGEDWSLKMYEVQWAINNAKHSVTKRTPSEMIFKYKPKGPNENPLTIEIIALNEKLKEREERPAEELLEENRNKMKERYDKKRKEGEKFSVGDLVLVRSEAPSTGTSRKLEPRYRGPYEVVKSLDNDRYLIKDIEGEQQSARGYEGIVAVDRLKPVRVDRVRN